MRRAVRSRTKSLEEKAVPRISEEILFARLRSRQSSRLSGFFLRSSLLQRDSLLQSNHNLVFRRRSSRIRGDLDFRFAKLCPVRPARRRAAIVNISNRIFKFRGKLELQLSTLFVTLLLYITHSARASVADSRASARPELRQKPHSQCSDHRRILASISSCKQNGLLIGLCFLAQFGFGSRRSAYWLQQCDKLLWRRPPKLAENNWVARAAYAGGKLTAKRLTKRSECRPECKPSNFINFAGPLAAARRGIIKKQNIERKYRG